MLGMKSLPQLQSATQTRISTQRESNGETWLFQQILPGSPSSVKESQHLLKRGHSSEGEFQLARCAQLPAWLCTQPQSCPEEGDQVQR